MVEGGSRDVGGSGKGSALTITTNQLTGRYVAGDFADGNDQDWFKVDLSENEHVTFHTAELESGADTVMEIWDDNVTGYQRIPDASKRWMRRDDDGGVESLSSHLHFVAPKAGTYYVKLKAYGAQSTGAYTLFVQQMGNYATSYPSYP